MSTLQILSTIAANLTATGCALLLLRRGPTRRLRLLTLSVGLMSMSQSVSFLHLRDDCTLGGNIYVTGHHMLIAALSLLSTYLLGSEIFDRNFVNKRLRLAEADIQRTDVPTAHSAPAEVEEPEVLSTQAIPIAPDFPK